MLRMYAEHIEGHVKQLQTTRAAYKEHRAQNRRTRRRVIQAPRFTCNVCGAECSRPLEDWSANGRLRALRIVRAAARADRSAFGGDLRALLALPEFPVLKGIRGIG